MPARLARASVRHRVGQVIHSNPNRQGCILLGVGWIIGSTKTANCIFRSSHDGWSDYYVGSITRVGIDVGVTNGSKLVWAVFAPGRVKRGSLAGGYAGAGAEATIGVGIGANALVGGFRRSINLQPVSVQGQTGLNIAGGIGSLTLRQR